MFSKTLIIVRHAHRNKLLGREHDNGISKKGRAQAQRVAEHFCRVFPQREPLMLSSPKVRCLETLEPLAKILKTKVEILPLIDEQHESDREFEKRLKKFCRWWKMKAPKLTIVCSHGDWVPQCLKVLTGVQTDLKKGGWAELVEKDGALKLLWLLQEIPE